ncbi:Translin-associated factor X-interacting N-terminus [Phytophthora infestans]|uniref:Translin-associated factor X-interacting N-terminus n=1 Tax=Phytophthora infestans TaxID=4787 RepID=A0A8S9U4F8_PHYIN|nr:Translin-associated factor X-interacting N-terminus [Phytophthora infestans]
MDFISVGLASPPFRRPTQRKALQLPPRPCPLYKPPVTSPHLRENTINHDPSKSLPDDSRTRPALLQELLEYLHTELDGERESRKPSLRRLQIVREALNRLIDGFSAYAPVLLQIRDEYERAVEDLHARNLMIPGLQTRLQSMETHCLQQLSAYSAEAKARSLVLKKRLAETQALLAASTAENARLIAALRSEKDNVTKAESKLTDVQRSTLTLSE